MAQTTILAAGTTAADSSDVPIAAGKSAVFSLLSASPANGVELSIVLVVTGGDPTPIEMLGRKPVVVNNPTESEIVVRVKRANIAASGQSVGAVAIT